MMLVTHEVTSQGENSFVLGKVTLCSIYEDGRIGVTIYVLHNTLWMLYLVCLGAYLIGFEENRKVWLKLSSF